MTLCLAVKRAWHTGQWYRRSPVCVTWWRRTRYRSGAVYGHRLHCHTPADNCRQPAATGSQQMPFSQTIHNLRFCCPVIQAHYDLDDIEPP